MRRPFFAPQAEAVLNQTAPLLLLPSSSSSSSAVASEPDVYTKAVSSLLSTPLPPSNFSPHRQLRQESRRSSPLPSARRDGEDTSNEGRTAAPVIRGGGSRSSSSGNALTYRVFLERLTRSESEGLVKAIRLFLFSILGNGGAVNPSAGRPRLVANRDIRRETEEVEVYGLSFLAQR